MLEVRGFSGCTLESWPARWDGPLVHNSCHAATMFELWDLDPLSSVGEPSNPARRGWVSGNDWFDRGQAARRGTSWSWPRTTPWGDDTCQRCLCSISRFPHQGKARLAGFLLAFFKVVDLVVVGASWRETGLRNLASVFFPLVERRSPAIFDGKSRELVTRDLAELRVRCLGFMTKLVFLLPRRAEEKNWSIDDTVMDNRRFWKSVILSEF